MDDDYRLWKFTNEDLNNFEKIEKQVLTMPYIMDSVEYLLSVIYRFENYVVDKITEGSKKGLRLRVVGKNRENDSNIIRILDEVEQYEEHLSIEERIYISKIKNLMRYLLKNLHVNAAYTHLQIRNNTSYLLEEHHKGKDEIKKELEHNAVLKEIPSRCLKKLAKECCELLIKNGKITEILEETKSEKRISDLVILEMEKQYKVRSSNKESINQYFRKLDLKLEKNKKRKLVVTDTYIRKKISKKV